MPQLAHKHICNHSHRRPSVYINTNQFDPTKTLTLRKSFARDMNKRFLEIMRLIRIAIVDEDVLGLLPPPPVVFQGSTPGNQAFKFLQSGEKVDAFMEWLRAQEGLVILERQQLGRGIQGAWTDKYIQSAYQKGIKQARTELKKEGFDVPSINESGGISSVFNQPVHADRVGILFTRTYNDLTGITTSMDSQISRVLAQGMADGDNPITIARKLTRTISGPVGDLGLKDTLGRFIPAKRRAKMLARTEVIRAHAEGTLQEFENWNVAGVRVRAEFVTAGDDRVCAECEGLEAQTFTIKEARNIIPVHVSCRCSWIPVTVN